MKKKTYLKPDSQVLEFDLSENLMIGGQTSMAFPPKDPKPGVDYPDI
jgi:hypothetical protein